MIGVVCVLYVFCPLGYEVSKIVSVVVNDFCTGAG